MTESDSFGAADHDSCGWQCRWDYLILGEDHPE